MGVSDTDLAHLRRCVELAREGLDDGDEPFGSVLVDGSGVVRFEDRNRVKDGDETRHPEFEIAKWSASHLTAEERAAATVYTSGEHCPMCSAAHGWMGLGRIVYAVSSAQLTAWRAEWGLPAGPVRPLPIQDVAPGVPVDGPAPELGGRDARAAPRARPTPGVRRMRVLLALGGNAMTNDDGRARPEDQIAAAQVAMAAVADLLARTGDDAVDVVITHGNGPQVGNLLVKNELAAAVVPPVPLDWCGAQTQATLGFVLMNALEAALVGARPVPAYRRRRHPRPGRRARPRVPEADQADRPLPAGRPGPPARRARRDLGGPRREGLAPRGRLARAAGDPRRARRADPGRPTGSWSWPTAAAGSRSCATSTARCAASRP